MYSWILMVDMFIVFMFLLCWLYVHFMKATMFFSQRVFTCDLISDKASNDMRKKWFMAILE